MMLLRRVVKMMAGRTRLDIRALGYCEMAPKAYMNRKSRAIQMLTKYKWKEDKYCRR
jgi:hypothetical protein